MACIYTYKGADYTKDELIEALSDDLFKDLDNSNVFRSIAVAKSKSADILSDTVVMLNQRYQDAKNMLQAVKNSSDSKQEKLKKIAYYKNIMERTNQTRKDFLATSAEKQLDYILDIANGDIKLVNSLYSSNKLTFSELQFANSIVDTWVNLNKALDIESEYSINDTTPEGKALKDKISNILATYRGLDERTREIAIQLIIDSNKGGTYTKEELLKLVDTSILTEYTRELGTAGIPLTNKLAYIIKETNFNINREHNDIHESIDKKYDKIKDNALFKKMGWDLFIKTQKNKDGSETLAPITRYSQKFEDTLRSVNQQRRLKIDRANGDKEQIKKAWKEYNEWNNRNTVVFNGLSFLEMDKYSDEQREKEINRMKALGFEESEINNIIAESQKMYDKFLNNKEEYAEMTQQEIFDNPAIIPSGMSEEDYIKEKVEEYDNLNNPVKYLSQKFTTGQIITAYGGARYSYLIAAKEIDGKSSEYYDENFQKIVNDPALFEYYSWFKNFMDETLGWLPEEEIQDLGSNFLPVIADRVAKEYGFTAMKESVKGLGDWFMKALTDNNYEQKIEKSGYSKKERRQFQSRFIKESVAIEDRTKNLVTISKLFADMALVYKHKNTIKAEVDTINDVLQSIKGSYQLNKSLGELERTEKEAVHIKSLADFTVRKGFYGIKSEDPLWKSEKLFYDVRELLSFGFWKSDKAKKAQALQNNLKDISNKLNDTSSLTEKQIEELQMDYENKKNEFYKLGGRAFSLTAAIDSSIGTTRMTSLGFAPFSAIRNLLVGKINNKIHAQGGRDFTKKELLWANKQILQASGKYWSGGKMETKMTKLIFGLMSDGQLAEGEDGIYLKTMVDKHTTIDKLREMAPKAYTWLSSGDYHFKAEMLLSAMKFEKVKTSKGEFSLIDVLNGDREFNSEEFGEWDKDANEGLDFSDFYTKKMLKYRQLANKLHGATGKEIYVKGKDNAIGRALFLFKSWLPETVGVRFDPLHKDAMLDRNEEGYYRTFGKKILEKKFGIFKMIAQTLFNQKNGITDPMELANFKKAVKELQIITTIWMAYMLLKAMAPDDDKNKKIYNLLVLRQLHDLRRDLTYYSDINSVSDLQREIIPVFKTVRDWGDAMHAAAYHGLGVKKDNGEDMYDDERTILKITKVLPVFSNINRVNFYMKGISASGTRY